MICSSARRRKLSSKEFNEEAARLAKLPRAERFEQLIKFPTRHTFKVIGRSEGLSGAVTEALESMGFQHVVLVERYSAKGRHLSVTFELPVTSGAQLDTIYTALEGLDGVTYLF